MGPVTLPGRPAAYHEGKHGVIRLAISDPGSLVARLRWPDTSGIAEWEYESLPNWQARAVSAALRLAADPLPLTSSGVAVGEVDSVR